MEGKKMRRKERSYQRRKLSKKEVIKKGRQELRKEGKRCDKMPEGKERKEGGQKELRK